MEVWSSLVYGSGLENRRVVTPREFESHSFRQLGNFDRGGYCVPAHSHALLTGVVQYRRFTLRLVAAQPGLGRIWDPEIRAETAVPFKVSWVVGRVAYGNGLLIRRVA